MNEKLPFRFQIQMGGEENPLFLTSLDTYKRLEDGRLHPQYQFTLNQKKALYLNQAGATYWMKRLEHLPIRLIELSS